MTLLVALMSERTEPSRKRTIPYNREVLARTTPIIVMTMWNPVNVVALGGNGTASFVKHAVRQVQRNSNSDGPSWKVLPPDGNRVNSQRTADTVALRS